MRKALPTYLFIGVFIIKMMLCLATIKYDRFDSKRMYSVIMQLEHEHETHSSEDNKDFGSKEIKWTKSDQKSIAYIDNLKFNKRIISWLNLYPINDQYTNVITPPPEFIA